MINRHHSIDKGIRLHIATPSDLPYVNIAYVKDSEHGGSSSFNMYFYEKGTLAIIESLVEALTAKYDHSPERLRELKNIKFGLAAIRGSYEHEEKKDYEIRKEALRLYNIANPLENHAYVPADFSVMFMELARANVAARKPQSLPVPPVNVTPRIKGRSGTKTVKNLALADHGKTIRFTSIHGMEIIGKYYGIAPVGYKDDEYWISYQMSTDRERMSTVIDGSARVEVIG